MLFDTVEDWLARYSAAGLADVQVRSGPFEMMTARGFLSDEGLRNAIRVIARAMTNGDSSTSRDLDDAANLPRSPLSGLCRNRRTPARGGQR